MSGNRFLEAAQEYLRKLPQEHFMEAVPQAKQRQITLESLDLVCARRADFHVFNELLVQYSLPGRQMPGQVVPDNMVVHCPEPIQADLSYDVPLQPVGPFWVLDYLSRCSKRKDYDDNMRRDERDLKVPYYLRFATDEHELTLYRYQGNEYAQVVPNELGRCPIPELQLEVGLLAGWARFWFRGELLLLPAELLSEVARLRAELAAIRKQGTEP